MRYYLDTNILVFMKTMNEDDICHEVRDILADYGNLLYTSSVCVQEFIQLCQLGKVGNEKRGFADAQTIISWIKQRGIEIIPVTEKHLQTMAEMDCLHSDPYDRLIIAQAISDQVSLISSDGMFRCYKKFGLNFVYNKR